RLLSDLLGAGVPVHGIGFQCHLAIDGLDIARDRASFARNLQRFAALGLELYVTEMDVRLPLPATAACLAQPAFRGFQTWGFTDKYSWIPHRFLGQGAALPLDEHYRPKPAYDALRECLLAPPAAR